MPSIARTRGAGSGGEGKELAVLPEDKLPGQQCAHAFHGAELVGAFREFQVHSFQPIQKPLEIAVGGDNQQPPARTQHAGRLGHEAGRVGNVLQDIDGDGGVKGGGGEGQALAVGHEGRAAQAAGAPGQEHFGRNIGPGELGARQHGRGRPGPGAQFQHPGGPGQRVLGQSFVGVDARLVRAAVVVAGEGGVVGADGVVAVAGRHLERVPWAKGILSARLCARRAPSAQPRALP
jgi:hypothetical protein